MSWRYLESEYERDQRLDFLRGLAMAFVVMFHVGGVSLVHLFAMFGVEVVAGGEVFVLISGVSLGRAQRARIEREGWSAASRHLLKRAGQLYLLYVIVAMSGWLLAQLHLPAADVLTTWRNEPGDAPLSMYGEARTAVDALIGVVLLRYGPWQYGIVGLFVILAAAAPVALWLLTTGRWWLLLAASWLLYGVGVTQEIRLLNAVFEGGAPILTWQLMFAHGLASGYYRERVYRFMATRAGVPLIAVSFLVGAGLIYFSLNAPWVNDVLWQRLPGWARPSTLPTERFYELRSLIFGTRQWPALGRIASVAAAAVVFTTILTVWWVPARRSVGWLVIPLGRASLFAFTVHIYLVFIIAQLGLIEPRAILANSVVQACAVLLTWVATRAWLRGRQEHVTRRLDISPLGHQAATEIP